MKYIKHFEDIDFKDFVPAGAYKADQYVLCVKHPDEESSGIELTVGMKYTLHSTTDHGFVSRSFYIKDNNNVDRRIFSTNNRDFTRDIHSGIIFTKDDNIEQFQKRMREESFDL